MTPKGKSGWLAVAVTVVCAYEGLALNEYPDIGGVPTICYGETKGVHRGDTATKAQCDEKLSKRLVEFNNGVNSCVTAELPDKRRAAFVSLSYNVGTAAFCGSTIPTRINAGDVVGACNVMLDFNGVCIQRNSAGKCVKKKVVKGLTNRREKEREMCLEAQ